MAIHKIRIILLFLLLTSFFIIACDGEAEREAYRYSQQREQLAKEAEQWMDLYRKDVNEGNKIIERYNAAEYPATLSIIAEYEFQSKKHLNHIDQFLVFIENNEVILKGRGMDIFEWKILLQDEKMTVQRNLADMGQAKLVKQVTKGRVSDEQVITAINELDNALS